LDKEIINEFIQNQNSLLNSTKASQTVSVEYFGQSYSNIFKSMQSKQFMLETQICQLEKERDSLNGQILILSQIKQEKHVDLSAREEELKEEIIEL